VGSHAAVRRIKARYGPELLARAGVNGVGVERDTSGEYYLAVHVDKDAGAAGKTLPREIEGQKVKVVVGGPFRALDDPRPPARPRTRRADRRS
jgi:hypothetical protein